MFEKQLFICILSSINLGKRQKITLKTVDESHKDGSKILVSASQLICMALDRGRYALIKTIFNAISPKYLRAIIKAFLEEVFDIRTNTMRYALIETLLLSDKGKYITAKLFEMMEKKDGLDTILNELVEHPDVNSEQFAITVAAILPKNSMMRFYQDMLLQQVPKTYPP